MQVILKIILIARITCIVYLNISSQVLKFFKTVFIKVIYRDSCPPFGTQSRFASFISPIIRCYQYHSCTARLEYWIDNQKIEVIV